jgi:hypothetical protein
VESARRVSRLGRTPEGAREGNATSRPRPPGSSPRSPASPRRTFGLRHTAIAGLFRLQGWDLDDVAARVAEAERIPLRVPLTAVFSRRDGIVAWQACVDTRTPEAAHFEARSCHWGLGFDPEVLSTLAARLAPPR